MATLGDALYGGLLRQLLASVCTVFCISIALVFARYLYWYAMSRRRWEPIRPTPDKGTTRSKLDLRLRPGFLRRRPVPISL